MLINAQQQIDESENLESTFVSFVKAILAQMKQWYRKGEVEESIHIIQYFDESGFRPTIKTKSASTFVWLFRYTHLEECMNMEEASRCAQLHWDAGLFRYPYMIRDDNGVPFTSKSYEFEQVKGWIILDLLFIVDDLWRIYNTFRLTDEQIIKHYQRFKQLWISPVIRYEVTFPLPYVDGDLQESYQIGPHLWLGPFTPEEKIASWNSERYQDPAMSNPIDYWVFAETKFRLKGFRLQEKEIEGLDTKEVVRELRDIITVLRLFKKGAVGAPAIFEKGDVHSWKRHSGYNRSIQLEDRVNDYEISRLSLPSRYVLSTGEVTRIKSLFDALQQLGNHPSAKKAHKPHRELTVALRRFNQTYGREAQEDRIIDLTIALESSLLAGDNNFSKKKKLATRGAALLARFRNPNETEAILHEMYEIRNKIVHAGNSLSELGKEPQEFAQMCENIVRDILKEYIFRLTNKDGLLLQSVNTDLDQFT